MIELKNHARLAQHFKSVHIFTWPVDLTKLSRLTEQRQGIVVRREVKRIFGVKNVIR